MYRTSSSNNLHITDAQVSVDPGNQSFLVIFGSITEAAHQQYITELQQAGRRSRN